MAKRTKNGVVDPYATRRRGATRRDSCRQFVVPLNKGGMVLDRPELTRALADINREAREKEMSIASSFGPPSAPPEPHYPKSFRIPVKKEE